MDLAIKLIVLLPLLAAAIAGLFCRIIGDRPAQIVTCAALLIAAALSIFVFVRIGLGPENAKLVVVKLFTWMDSGTLTVDWSLRVDTLTAVMLIVVTGVSSMVHVYSVGYMGKSAQIGLHTWLPDAMEGPTPVSALIHAATMVTAGVFMVCRLSPLFELAPIASAVVTLVGAATAFFAATIGLTQFDIKRVVAYSTCSQLGYMFFAAGVGSYSAAMFHLTTHAFFKALLFLGSGSVITCLHHEQDMRLMGGVKEKAPQTFYLMWIGTLSLSGIGVPFVLGNGIGFSGFYSKDMMEESAYGVHTTVGLIAFWLGVVAAFMTAFYSTRLMFLTFYGSYRGDHHTWEHAHESPAVILIPLYVLAAGALLSGYVAFDWFVGHDWAHFWGQSIAVRSTEEVLHHAH